MSQQNDPSEKRPSFVDLFFTDWDDDDDDLIEMYQTEQTKIKEKEVQKNVPTVTSRNEPAPTLTAQVSCTTITKLPVNEKRSRSDAPSTSAWMEKQEGKFTTLPDYLLTTNATLEQMIRSVTSNVASSINIETVRQIAILIHQCAIIDLEKSLWLTFLKSGTDTLKSTDQTGPKYWPEKLKSIIENTSEDNDSRTDENYLTLVQTYLRRLEDRQQQYQMKLTEKTKPIYISHPLIEPSLHTFIQQNLQALQMENEFEIAMIEYEYECQQLQFVLRNLNLTNEQIRSVVRVGQRKYEQEKSRQEVSFLKEHIRKEKLIDSLQSVQINMPSYIEIIQNQSIRQQLSERHKKLIQQYKKDMMKVFYSTSEIYMIETQKLFDDEMAKLWQNQRNLPIHQRFTPKVLNLMEQHLKTTTEIIQCIYKYKMYQSFGESVTS